MENHTPAAAVVNTNNNGTTTGTAKVASVGVKLHNHGQDEEHSNFNVEEHMVEKVEENGEEEDEDVDEGEEATRSVPTSQQPSRTPFTNLSQVDADLALARTLQEQGLSASKKRVNNSLHNSTQFNSACDSAFSHCLSLTQHTFEGVFPYQLKTASDHIHTLLSDTNNNLIHKWVPTPPDRTQVDAALRRVSSPYHDNTLRLPIFKDWAREIYTDASASKALLVRVPVGVAGIVGISAIARPAPALLGTFVGAYSFGVALSIFLGLSSA